MARVRSYDNRNDWLRRWLMLGAVVLAGAIIVALLLYRSTGGSRAAGWVMAIAFFGWLACVAVDAFAEFMSDRKDDKLHRAIDKDLDNHPSMLDSDEIIDQQHQWQANDKRRRLEDAERMIPYRHYLEHGKDADKVPWPLPEEVARPQSSGESNL